MPDCPQCGDKRTGGGGGEKLARKLAVEFEAERRQSAVDRMKIDMVYGANGGNGWMTRLEDKVNNNKEATSHEINELKGWVKWGTGAIAALGAAAALANWGIKLFSTNGR